MGGRGPRRRLFSQGIRAALGGGCGAGTGRLQRPRARYSDRSAAGHVSPGVRRGGQNIRRETILERLPHTASGRPRGCDLSGGQPTLEETSWRRHLRSGLRPASEDPRGPSDSGTRPPPRGSASRGLVSRHQGRPSRLCQKKLERPDGTPGPDPIPGHRAAGPARGSGNRGCSTTCSMPRRLRGRRCASRTAPQRCCRPQQHPATPAGAK